MYVCVCVSGCPSQLRLNFDQNGSNKKKALNKISGKFVYECAQNGFITINSKVAFTDKLSFADPKDSSHLGNME